MFDMLVDAIKSWNGKGNLLIKLDLRLAGEKLGSIPGISIKDVMCGCGEIMLCITNPNSTHK